MPKTGSLVVWLSVVAGVPAGPAMAQDAVTAPAPAETAAMIELEPEIAARPPVECDADMLPQVRSTWRGTLWTNGIVPYVFSDNATTSMRAAMCEAMDELQQVCNVSFVPRTTQSNYIFIQNSTGNNSYVGMIGGSQTVNIYNWNYKYIMAHELMHALGETHEQSRPDRGTYVQINTDNICQTCCSGNPCNGNFNISSTATTVGEYDFESVMHYGQNAFSTNGQPTIVCLPPYTAFQSVIGNRSYLSMRDKAGLAARYGQPVDDASEPNDTLATAMVLNEGMTGLMLNDRDDYWRVQLPTGPQTITVTGWAQAVAEGGRAWLQTTVGGTIASPLMTAGAAGSPPAATINVNVAAGTYILRVSRGCGQGGGYAVSLPPTCGADFNGSGTASVQDIFDYLESYFSGEFPRADFNRSGIVSVQDIFDFLAGYFACV